MNPSIITITGTASAGKSTIVEKLASSTGLPLYCEDLLHNPMLEEWYKNPYPWDYMIHLFFHSRRVAQQYLAEKTGGVLERSLYDGYIFIDLALEVARDPLRIKLLKELRRELDSIVTIHKRPDLLVYLSVDSATQKKRIQQRNRKDEDKIAEDFLPRLNSAYEHGFQNENLVKPDLIIDTSNLKVYEILEIIQKKL
jgi:deoxyadenosine/deoxycytidine kinase